MLVLDPDPMLRTWLIIFAGAMALRLLLECFEAGSDWWARRQNGAPLCPICGRPPMFCTCKAQFP